MSADLRGAATPADGPAAATAATTAVLAERGLITDGRLVVGSLVYERPAYIHGHRLKDCTAGAFTFFNAAGMTSAFRVHFGRYAQIGESSIIGPPEHPIDWFSSHMFAFTRPQQVPGMYQLPDFARLAPDADAGPSWVETQPNETIIGHEAYIGAGSFIKRGVTVGAGAVVGARSVVTRDVPPYAIVVGSPARVVRMRFDDKLVERFLALQWWRYDLAPYKRAVDFSQVEATLAFFEERVANGTLPLLQPHTYRIRRGADGRFDVEALAAPLF
ncbi:MAG: CatB-related O-acetyltransferase [Pseudomonadota bacterium]